MNTRTRTAGFVALGGTFALLATGCGGDSGGGGGGGDGGGDIASASSTCNFGEVFSTDGRIVSNDLTVLEDDKAFFVPYNAALTLRQETLDEFPDIADLMAPLSEAITDETITAMNSSVDNDGETEADVATAFLEDNDLLQGGGELDGATLTVGAKEFTESKVLGQLTAQILTDAGATVDDASLAGSATVREALVSSEIDMYWEYTGTGWVNILGNTTTDLPEDLFAAVKEADAANGIAWLDASPMNDTYAITVSSAFAEETGIASLSDAAALVKDNADLGTICAASEFINRDDGLPGVEDAYGIDFGEPVELDLGLIYTQVGT